LFTAIDIFKTFNAFALAFFADSVSAAIVWAFILDGAIFAEEAFVANAAAVYAFSVIIAVADFFRTIWALPACFADTFSVVAFSMV
jgi:hypothetical protein